MSAIRDAAARAERALNQAYTELASLEARQSLLESTYAQQNRAGRDTQGIALKLRAAEKAICEKEARIDKIGLEFRAAVANLAAERQLAKEQAREAERQKEREKQRSKEIEVDDFGL